LGRGANGAVQCGQSRQGNSGAVVSFRQEPKLDLLVPGEMIERRRGSVETLEGRATYTNFRRFRVDTSMEIK
jgi:hypothetical protein